VTLRLAVAAAVGALALFPLAGRDYYATLMLPFFGYGIALLGLNLLFGTTGLLSFGHALFVALGAYTAAFLTSKLGVLDLELILATAAVVGAAVAVPTGLLCVRYVRIYFGMLTLAFGMLFYSFLLKFYAVTGGDEGMRVLRPRLVGQAWASFGKVEFLTGPFYYYSLAVLIVGAVVMWRIVRSPFGLGLRAIRENAGKAEFTGVDVRRCRPTPSWSRRSSARSAVRCCPFRPAWPIRCSPTGPTPATSSSCCCWAASGISSARWWAPSSSSSSRTR